VRNLGGRERWVGKMADVADRLANGGTKKDTGRIELSIWPQIVAGF
jgi:hypothetical protein